MTAAQLGDEVRIRRTQLGLRQADLEHEGGPSLGTVQNIEHASRATYTPRTFARIDQALRWRPGSARDCLHRGLVPVLAADGSARPLARENDNARALRIGHLVIALAGELAEELQRPG